MIIYVKVHPGSKEELIEKITDNDYIAYIKERAEKGKANAALVRLLSKKFHVASGNIMIKNPSSRKKVVEIEL
ncbi:DUF167 domain-containing protein [Candidatus Pacearchaeota archaeon]|nr:DUF167 domain-containing protein [Candidatus Pacearchaeota archaeon]